MELRTLHPEADESLYRAAWAWRLSYPRLVRKWDGLKHFRQWFALMKRRVTVAVFTDRLIALVTLRPAGNNTYEVHVDCERGTNIVDLLTALLSMRQTVFEDWKASEVFAGVISRNYAIIQIASLCGFTPDGVEEQAGKLKFIRLRMTRDEFYQNTDHYRHTVRAVQQPEHLRANAGGVVA